MLCTGCNAEHTFVCSVCTKNPAIRCVQCSVQGIMICQSCDDNQAMRCVGCRLTYAMICPVCQTGRAARCVECHNVWMKKYNGVDTCFKCMEDTFEMPVMYFVAKREPCVYEYGQSLDYEENWNGWCDFNGGGRRRHHNKQTKIVKGG